MFKDSWTCVMVEKGPGLISDEIRAALKIAACRLHLNKFDASQICSDVCDGYIETDWSHHLLGGRGGILFKAQITGEAGDFKVNFLFSERDLKRGADLLEEIESGSAEGAWVRGKGEIPVPELYQFLDFGSARAH